MENNIKFITQDQEKFMSKVSDSMLLIHEKEPLMAEVIHELIQHIAKTYADKYSSKDSSIDTKTNNLYHPTKGKIVNLYQMARYMQRFDTTGYEKSENPVDMLKAIHFGLFDLVRKKLHPNTK